MTAITVGSAAPLAAPRNATPKKSLFARAWDAFVDARTLQAEREIARHQHLLPVHLEQTVSRLGRSEKDRPLAR